MASAFSHAIAALSMETVFLSGRGVAILENEFVWIWIPAIAIALLVFAVKWITKRNSAH
jgi:hypothetical protein